MTIQWFSYINPTGYELALTLPGECIDACSASGDVSESVNYWVRRLGFDPPEAATADYLRSTGGWEDDELTDHDANARRLLWIIACDLRAEYEEAAE